MTHCSLRDADTPCVMDCRSHAGEGCLWVKQCAERGATPPPRFTVKMSPEQINQIEWGITARTIKDMQRLIEGGCEPGRRTWIDPVLHIAESRAKGEA